MSARACVLSAYRRIFRARKELFMGDHQAMAELRVAIKDEFVKNQKVPTSGEHFEALLYMVDEAIDMMRYGIVRGDLNEKTGNYEVKFKPEHTEGVEHSNVEPITAETVSRLEKPMVETSCAGTSKKEPSF
jgi:hypothetical protein